MDEFYLDETREKGKGLFTSSDLRKGDILFHVDLRGLNTYTLEDIDSENLDGDHAHYVGRGRYVIEDGFPAFMNHSCEPNCYYLKHGIGIYDVVAFRDIGAGEELTHDYAASSINQLEGLFYFEEECHCGSPKCRKVIHGNFFRLPEDWQRKYYPYLPPSIRRKYRDRFKWIGKERGKGL